MKLQNCVTYNGQVCDLLIQIENFRFYKFTDKDSDVQKLLFAKDDNALIEIEYTKIGFTAEKIGVESPYWK